MVLDAVDDINIVFATIIKFGNIVVRDRSTVCCLNLRCKCGQTRREYEKISVNKILL